LSNNKLIANIITNWPVKVLSIALALLLFVFNRLNTLTTRPLSVPLIIETSSTLVPASAYPQNVRVNLRGEDEGIKSIAESDIEAYVDLSRYEDGGLYSAPVLVRKKGRALGIEPLEIAVYPPKITVQLDQRIIKTIPLTAAIRGRASDGFDLVSYTLSPQEVVLAGPRSSLESVVEIETDSVELDGRNSDFTAVVNIINPNPLFVLRGNGTAEFSCVIRPSVSVRSIEDIPIFLSGLVSALEADTGGKTGSVRIEGRQSDLDNFQPHPELLTVVCSGLYGPGTYTLPVEIDLPPELSLIRREPEELTLTVTLKEVSFLLPA
jgi:YbbR domain-containing protein